MRSEKVFVWSVVSVAEEDKHADVIVRMNGMDVEMICGDDEYDRGCGQTDTERKEEIEWYERVMRAFTVETEFRVTETMKTVRENADGRKRFSTRNDIMICQWIEQKYTK